MKSVSGYRWIGKHPFDRFCDVIGREKAWPIRLGAKFWGEVDKHQKYFGLDLCVESMQASTGEGWPLQLPRSISFERIGEWSVA